MKFFLAFLVTFGGWAIISQALAEDNHSTTIETSTTSKLTHFVTLSTRTSAASTASIPSTTYQVDPDKEPVANSYNVTNSEGKYCIAFKATIKLNFNYQKVGNLTQNVTGHVYIPSVEEGTTVTGSCNKSSTLQTMTLTFFNDWHLELSFVKNLTTNNYQMGNFQLSYNITPGSLPFPDADGIGEKTTGLKVEDGPIGTLSSYVCLSQRTLNPTTAEEVGLHNANVASEQYEAFVELDEVVFSPSRVRCENDKISNMIPIAVGAALGALIIIILVAYIIGRHKSRKGYESV